MRLSTQLLLAVSLILLSIGRAGAQLRIVDYNTTGVNSTAALQTIFTAIGQESVNGVAKPLDVLILQEQDSVAGDTQTIVNILNGIYGPGAFARSTINGATLGAGRPALIYNTKTVSLISEAQIGSTSSSGPARAPMRYQVRPVGYDAASDFYIYASHYHSSSSSRRLAEAQLVRTDANALGQGKHIIHAGDFNIDSSSESMYQHLLSPGNAQFFDPINAPGSWHDNSNFKGIHTQNPAGSGFVGGGMDDRFDFQMITDELRDNEGMSYLTGSYHAFGNNNTHTFNGHINTGAGASAAVLNDLGQTSDHLPVVAQYQVPAQMDIQVAAVPTQVVVGAALSAQIEVANSAGDGVLVASAIGADELDYSVTSGGAASGAAIGTSHAFGAANEHQFNLNTATAGAKSATFLVSATSPQVTNPTRSQFVNYSVLDHANASFANDADTHAITLDFGTIPLGHEAQMGLSIHNLVAMPGFTASLDLTSALVTGDHEVFSTNVQPFANLAAGASLSFQATFTPNAPGTFSADYIFTVSDTISLVGAAVGQPLVLHVTGRSLANAAGDFDLDGDVDGADFVTWQTSFPMPFGATRADGDAEGDSDVDGADFAFWQDGFSAPPAQSRMTIPEPASLLTAWIGTFCIAALAWRASSKRPLIPSVPRPTS